MYHRGVVVCVVLVMLTGLPDRGQGEVFTALIHMEGLLGLERELLGGLNSYIVAERRRLQDLEDFGNRVQQARDVIKDDDPSQHLYDPVNAFQLVNRYINGWEALDGILRQDNAQDLMANISLNQYCFPSQEDFEGAMMAIRRLQDTYKLESSTIASGELGKSPSLTMDSEDCYMVGYQSYQQKHYQHTRSWMLEALRRFDEENGMSTIDIPSIYDYLSFSEYQLGNMKKATMYTRELLQNDPTHQRALSNLQFFEDMEANDPEQYVDTGEREGAEVSLRDIYMSLCREPVPTPGKDHHKLICFYYDNDRNPRLILRPQKVEVAFSEPKIYIFRDSITEKEMSRLKDLARPMLKRATVANPETGDNEPAEYRISESGWIAAEDDPLGYVTRIDQRIEDVTGLTMETAEELQVVNYGIGGHYDPHYDFLARSGEDVFSTPEIGARIATLLFYLSDVELGGATVFPLIGARIAPSSGDAAFWWNLKKSGKEDYLTLHAGCPVLVGSKWVCNKWIHERGQEFTRPCGLSPKE